MIITRRSFLATTGSTALLTAVPLGALAQTAPAPIPRPDPIPRPVVDFEKIEVRRIMLMVHESIQKAYEHVMGEPVDWRTRNLIKSSINGDLRDMTNQRLLYQYRIVCDETNNPPKVVDRSDVVTDVFFQIPRSSDYHVLRGRYSARTM